MGAHLHAGLRRELLRELLLVGRAKLLLLVFLAVVGLFMVVIVFLAFLVTCMVKVAVVVGDDVPCACTTVV